MPDAEWKTTQKDQYFKTLHSALATIIQRHDKARHKRGIIKFPPQEINAWSPQCNRTNRDFNGDFAYLPVETYLNDSSCVRLYNMFFTGKMNPPIEQLGLYAAAEFNDAGIFKRYKGNYSKMPVRDLGFPPNPDKHRDLFSDRVATCKKAIKQLSREGNWDCISHILDSLKFSMPMVHPLDATGLSAAEEIYDFLFPFVSDNHWDSYSLTLDSLRDFKLAFSPTKTTDGKSDGDTLTTVCFTNASDDHNSIVTLEAHNDAEPNEVTFDNSNGLPLMPITPPTSATSPSSAKRPADSGQTAPRKRNSRAVSSNSRNN